ncbi:peptidase M20/M25/M40 family protein [Striga asiatica]|uniref:Peptidase M20/M25/M40 family protein n=1 Tax=Striga asiatica TaxID=4170 RepID=A0A5A7PRG6_STRAF|nr:peptidase M20/M25/M40 family protein [Striga asiatica]
MIMAASSVTNTLGDLNKDSFVSLLSKLIGESKHVQNNPPELIPEEDRIVGHVLDVLRPFSTANGGPLVINHVAYKPRRGNLIVEYPGTEPGKVLSFVGMHMDVVTANPCDWVNFLITRFDSVIWNFDSLLSVMLATRENLGILDFDPFTLSIDGDKLRGRGTTDCLGHVALVAELMRRLGETKPQLKSTVVAVFIASEENSSIPGVGVDALVKDGLLDKLKQGPLFWIDTADKQPCIGTGGMIPWKLHVTGKLFHSGLAHKAINPLELAMEALKVIQSRFYTDFPPHPKEKVYGYATPSTMKPTQWNYPGGGINQIPAECTVCGDVRLTPFYRYAINYNTILFTGYLMGCLTFPRSHLDCANIPFVFLLRNFNLLLQVFNEHILFSSVSKVMKKLQEYVEELNTNIEKIDTRGPVSKYVLPDEDLRGRLTITFDEATSGVACNLESRGFHVLCKSTEEVVGHVKPYSITGSLPLIRELQDEGFDVQTSGYGLMATYHAKNEYCLLSDMCQGYGVFVRIISQLED